MADDAIVVPNPVIVVEVLSPGTASTDTGAKLAGYFLVPSIAHDLIVHPTRRTVIHHRRTADGIDTRIIVNGPIAMDPPGIVITVEEIYAADPIRAAWPRPKLTPRHPTRRGDGGEPP